MGQTAREESEMERIRSEDLKMSGGAVGAAPPEYPDGMAPNPPEEPGSTEKPGTDSTLENTVIGTLTRADLEETGRRLDSDGILTDEEVLALKESLSEAGASVITAGTTVGPHPFAGIGTLTEDDLEERFGPSVETFATAVKTQVVPEEDEYEVVGSTLENTAIGPLKREELEEFSALLEKQLEVVEEISATCTPGQFLARVDKEIASEGSVGCVEAILSGIQVKVNISTHRMSDHSVKVVETWILPGLSLGISRSRTVAIEAKAK